MKKEQKNGFGQLMTLSESSAGKLVGGFSASLTATISIQPGSTDPVSNNCKAMNCVGCGSPGSPGNGG